jgi:NADH:ubiquinone oxidoreductase subunit
VSVLKSIFTWWNGATVGIRFTIAKHGVFVGQDEYGNKYYEARTNRHSYDAKHKRRWVVFNGYAEASKVSPDWHGWLHYTFDEPPTTAPLPRRGWEKEHRPNLTGTIHAYRPKGSLARGGERQRATGDYEAWKPE